MLIWTLTTGGAIVSSLIPQTLEYIRILAGDTSLPACVVRELPGGTDLELRGGLRAGSADQLEKALASAPKVTVLHVNSIGGRLHEAERMARLVRERGLTTYTSERCLSAATLVFIAGKERVVAAGAKMGFHRWAFPGTTAELRKEGDRRWRESMYSAGVENWFIDRVLETPNESMWYPTYDEMLSAHVVTSQSLGERFATSWGLANTKSDSAMQKEFTSLPCFGTIQELEPQAYAGMISEFMAALRAGKSEGEAVAAISQATGSLMEKYLPAASDEALLALRDQWIAILSQYKENDSRACIAVFTQAKINYSRAFPGWDMTNSLRVVEKVMRSGASRVPVLVDKKAADEDLKVVRKRMANDYGTDLVLLQQESQWMDNSRKVCDMLLTMYRQMATLPKGREANLLRYLLCSKDE